MNPVTQFPEQKNALMISIFPKATILPKWGGRNIFSLPDRQQLKEGNLPQGKWHGIIQLCDLPLIQPQILWMILKQIAETSNVTSTEAD